MKSLLKILIITLTLLPSAAYSQYTYSEQKAKERNTFSSPETTHTEPKYDWAGLIKSMDDLDIFNSVELAANIGTTGLGLELATPVTKWAKLRAGFDWMPKFTVPMTFTMDSYVDGQVSDNFETIQSLMYTLTGMTVDKDIKMESKPTMTTFRLLVDVYPWQNNRHWHITAGFFLGSNSVGTSVNRMDEMPSLLALNTYNRVYDVISLPFEDFMTKIVDHPIYDDVFIDPEFAMQIYNNFHDPMISAGKLGVHVGDFPDGTPYMMLPDKDGTVSAKAIVNKFRPYLGFGYGGALSSDGKWQVSFDAGVQFWGGTPKVTTHDGTVLNDLKNLRGKVGKYMDMMKMLPVYPTIDFRISYRF